MIKGLEMTVAISRGELLIIFVGSWLIFLVVLVFVYYTLSRMNRDLEMERDTYASQNNRMLKENHELKERLKAFERPKS